MVVRAEILMRPSGESTVQIQPAGAGTDRLLQLAMCSGALVWRDLCDEPAHLLEAFEELSWEACEAWTVASGQPLLRRLPSAGPVGLKLDLVEGAPARHERYILQLYTDERGGAYPCRCLPPNPQGANRIAHFLALLQEIDARVEPEERGETQRMLRRWWHRTFRERTREGVGSPAGPRSEREEQEETAGIG